MTRPLLASLLALSLAPLTLAAPPKKPRPAPDAQSAASKAEIRELLAKAPKPERWPNASKATIHDFADITIRPDGSARTVTRQTIKIFANRARDEGEIKIPYNGSFETVTLVRARTIRPDGTVVAVKPADVRSATPSDYDDARILSFSMPAVEAGVIIDYEYITDQRASQLPGHFWSQWYFQSGFDPVAHTRLVVRTPRGMKLYTRMRNTQVEPTVRDSPDGKQRITVWEEKNLGPLFTEPLMPSLERMLPKLTYSTLPNWQTVAAWYSKLAEGRDVADAALAEKAREITKNAATPEEKARAIFYWVQDKTRYVAIELGESAYQPRPATKTVLNQYGDCKDMTTLLVAMLRAVGIKAYPVLLEAGASGRTSDELPAPSAFNHAICLVQIGAREYWLDATAEFCAFGEIPSADRGVDALVLRDGKGEFVTIPAGSGDDAESARTLDLTLKPDGSAAGTMTVTGTGDFALALRAQLHATPPDKLGNLAEAYANSVAANARVDKVSVSNFRNRDEPVKLTMHVSFPAWATLSGELLLFKARPDQTGGQFSNPLNRPDRNYPIVQRNFRRIKTRLNLTLPDGFIALSTPMDADLSCALGSYKRTIERAERSLSITTEINERRVEIPAKEYKPVQTYFDAYLKAYDESVILKKG